MAARSHDALDLGQENCLIGVSNVTQHPKADGKVEGLGEGKRE